MEQEQFDQILERYKAGKESPQELAFLEAYYKGFDQRPDFKDVDSSGKLWSDMKAAIDFRIDQALLEPTVMPKRLSLWPRIGIAAAVAAVIVSAGIWFMKPNSTKDQHAKNYVQDVSPGKSGATLTLANGQKILTKDALAGNIATQSGVKISKTADGQIIYEITDSKSGILEYNTLSTTRGEQTRVRLPDGSLVFLNAASSLKYPASFAKLEKRKVELTGEGYFEIAKDKAHPFVVESRGQEVEVLGTHFNINSYGDEPVIATTLLEGSVRLSALGEPRILKPGEQGLNNGKKINVVQADVDKITDWKDGDFNLNDIDFKSAMRKLSRWYDIEVIYDKSVPEDIESGGWISRNSKLSSVLKLIENSGQVKFRIEGKKVYVSK